MIAIYPDPLKDIRFDWLSSGKADDDDDDDGGEDEVLEEILNHNQIHVNTFRVGESSFHSHRCSVCLH